MKMIMIGAGGHALSCMEIIKSLIKIRKIIFFSQLKTNKIKGYLVKKFSMNEIKKFQSEYKNAHVSFGQINDLKSRSKMFNKLKKLGYCFPKIISKNCYLSKNSSVGEGSIIFNNVFINTEVKIGINCIINNCSTLEHNVVVGDHTHIAPGAIINGDVKIGKNCFIGSGAVLKQGIKIADYTFIQAGKIVLRDSKKYEIIK